MSNSSLKKPQQIVRSVDLQAEIINAGGLSSSEGSLDESDPNLDRKFDGSDENDDDGSVQTTGVIKRSLVVGAPTKLPAVIRSASSKELEVSQIQNSEASGQNIEPYRLNAFNPPKKTQKERNKLKANLQTSATTEVQHPKMVTAQEVQRFVLPDNVQVSEDNTSERTATRSHRRKQTKSTTRYRKRGGTSRTKNRSPTTKELAPDDAINLNSKQRTKSFAEWRQYARDRYDSGVSLIYNDFHSHAWQGGHSGWVAHFVVISQLSLFLFATGTTWLLMRKNRLAFRALVLSFRLALHSVFNTFSTCNDNIKVTLTELLSACDAADKDEANRFAFWGAPFTLITSATRLCSEQVVDRRRKFEERSLAQKLAENAVFFTDDGIVDSEHTIASQSLPKPNSEMAVKV